MRVELFYSFHNLIDYVNLPFYRWVNYEYKKKIFDNYSIFKVIYTNICICIV